MRNGDSCLLYYDLTDHLPNYTIVIKTRPDYKERSMTRVFSKANKENFANDLPSTEWSMVFDQQDANCACKAFSARVNKLLPAGCRKAANCRYYIYSQAKNQVFPPQGRLIAPIQVKLCRADGHLGPLGRAKFHLNRRRGWECGPKKSKISTFW